MWFDHQPVRERLGMNVKTFRKLKGWSQKALAEKVRKSAATICKIETEKTWVSDELLFDLAKVFEIEIEHLFIKKKAKR